MLRAILVFNLRTKYLTIHINYITWIICTHWAPQIICSFCLLALMTRSKGNENNNNRNNNGKYYPVDIRYSPNQMTSTDNTESTSPLLHPNYYSDDFDYDDEDLDIMNNGGDYHKHHHNHHNHSHNNNHHHNNHHNSQENDLFYNQEVTSNGSNNYNLNEYHHSPGTSPHHLSHNYSLFNPYVMSNDDSGESVISDDITFVNVQQGFNEFGNVLYDGIGIE